MPLRLDRYLPTDLLYYSLLQVSAVDCGVPVPDQRLQKSLLLQCSSA
jgi:hypothetical protein